MSENITTLLERNIASSVENDDWLYMVKGSGSDRDKRVRVVTLFAAAASNNGKVFADETAVSEGEAARYLLDFFNVSALSDFKFGDIIASAVETRAGYRRLSLVVMDSAITEGKIADNSVDTLKIKDSAVTTAKINNTAVTTDKLFDGSVTTSKIDDGSVTTAKIAVQAVDTANLKYGAVTSEKIYSGSIKTEKLDNSSVTSVKIANSAVTSEKLSDGSVSTSKIADYSITDAKLSTSLSLSSLTEHVAWDFSDGNITDKVLCTVSGIGINKILEVVVRITNTISNIGTTDSITSTFSIKPTSTTKADESSVEISYYNRQIYQEVHLFFKNEQASEATVEILGTYLGSISNVSTSGTISYIVRP